MAEAELFTACGRGDLDRVRTLVEFLGVDPDQVVNLAQRVDFSCYTPLHQACKMKQIEVVKYLIQNKHVRRVDPPDRDRMTPLHLVCANGCFELCRFLIEEGHAHIESEDKDGWRPLHWACFGGHKELVQYLVEDHRVDVGAQTKTYARWTPLSVAYRWRHLGVIRYLIPKSVSIDKSAFCFAFLKNFPWDLKLLLMEYYVRRTTPELPSNYSMKYPLHSLFLCPLPAESAYAHCIDQMEPFKFSSVDGRGRLPLHVALSVSSSNKLITPSILLKLARKEPRAARARDPANGLFPFQAGAAVSREEEEQDDDEENKWTGLVYQLARNYDPIALLGRI